MKRPLLAIALALTATSLSSHAASASTPALTSPATVIVCSYGAVSMRITCWDSNKEVVYRAVPFSQAFDEGWHLIEAYLDGSNHVWILSRRPQMTTG